MYGLNMWPIYGQTDTHMYEYKFTYVYICMCKCLHFRTLLRRVSNYKL